MSVQQRRKYDKDFKRNAVRLTEEAGKHEKALLFLVMAVKH